MLRLVSAVIVLALTAATASAAEIKVISANGMREVIAETKAAFEKASGHTLNVTVVETGTIRKRVLDGEAFDVIMVPSNASEIFVKEGKQAPGAVPVIRVNFGLAVRESGPKPDVSNADALKKTFLDAKTVLITDPSTGGISGGAPDGGARQAWHRRCDEAQAQALQRWRLPCRARGQRRGRPRGAGRA
jgi:molybdate transport system substrate-binding protein